MNQYLATLALVSAIVAALLTGMYGAWKELPVGTLALRSGVCAALVYAFFRFGGELAVNSILRGLAEHQLRQDEARRKSSSGESSPEERKAA
jgi:hypothetical protein